MIDGRDIIALGVPEGRHVGDILRHARSIAATRDGQLIAAFTKWQEIKTEIERARAAQLPLQQIGGAPMYRFLSNEEDGAARENRDAVIRTMAEVLRTPGVVAGAVLPDACPAGPVGTIPVGGVVASENIHPGMHSADICCSMFLSVFGADVEPSTILDAVHDFTHFGPGARRDPVPMPEWLDERIRSNPLTRDLIDVARGHFATQGDGNHFAYVGTSRNSGLPCLVTHHGSRGFGAKLYKKGMEIAEKFRAELSPETLPQNAWIPKHTAEGVNYWDALQIVRQWTEENHRIIHASVPYFAVNHLWNEHNFVFMRDDDLFYHAKGATPTGFKWAQDATDTTIIPLNMGAPILLVEAHPDAPEEAMGFAPHGAGRNMSRTAHIRTLDGADPEEQMAKETAGLDVRFYCGRPDVSELPSAYKNADTIIEEIERFKLARISDVIDPFGSIMAGDTEFDAPWRRKRREEGKE